MPTKEETAKAEAEAKAAREAKEVEDFISSVKVPEEEVKKQLQASLDEETEKAKQYAVKVHTHAHRGDDVVQGLKDAIKHSLSKKKAIFDHAKTLGITLTE